MKEELYNELAKLFTRLAEEERYHREEMDKLYCEINRLYVENDKLRNKNKEIANILLRD